MYYLQLGLHVHAAVNGERDRQVAGERPRDFQRLMRGWNGNGKDTTDGANQPEPAEVGTLHRAG